MVRNIRKDCFAAPVWVERDGRSFISCDALNLYIGGNGKAHDCESCSFYRAKSENDAILMANNGTTNIDEIIARYECEHGKLI